MQDKIFFSYSAMAAPQDLLLGRSFRIAPVGSGYSRHHDQIRNRDHDREQIRKPTSQIQHFSSGMHGVDDPAVWGGYFARFLQGSGRGEWFDKVLYVTG